MTKYWNIDIVNAQFRGWHLKLLRCGLFLDLLKNLMKMLPVEIGTQFLLALSTSCSIVLFNFLLVILSSLLQNGIVQFSHIFTMCNFKWFSTLFKTGQKIWPIPYFTKDIIFVSSHYSHAGAFVMMMNFCIMINHQLFFQTTWWVRYFCQCSNT